MKIVMVSPEVAPYSKSGGLGDVLGALPEALRRQGHEVDVFTPFYRCVKDGGYPLHDTGLRVEIRLGAENYVAEVWRHRNIRFIKNDAFFFRDELYGTASADYEDNPLRFAFFSLAVLESLKAMGGVVDIVHCHDWQAALIPLYLKKIYRQSEGPLSKTASIFTIHNLAYQGLFPRATMAAIGLPMDMFNPKELEFYGKVNFIKAALVFADILTTVSEKYSREIQGEDMGCGLEGVLRERSDHLFGIANGADYEKWNPENDSLIPNNYNSGNLGGKARCKRELKKTFGLPDLGDMPLIGMISRLDPQKGFDIIVKSARRLMELPVQMVFLGRGSELIRTFLEGLALRYPQKVGISTVHDEPLAHMIEAGSDIYLMPSRYEPCGLNHLYSLRYGTIPVVRATGGLDDIILNYSAKKRSGNGFKFRAYSPDALIRTLKRAVDLYMNDRKEWESLQKKMMGEDHSWNKSVAGYENVYRKAVRKAATGNKGGRE